MSYCCLYCVSLHVSAISVSELLSREIICTLVRVPPGTMVTRVLAFLWRSEEIIWHIIVLNVAYSVEAGNLRQCFDLVAVCLNWQGDHPHVGLWRWQGDHLCVAMSSWQGDHPHVGFVVLTGRSPTCGFVELTGRSLICWCAVNLCGLLLTCVGCCWLVWVSVDMCGLLSTCMGCCRHAWVAVDMCQCCKTEF